MNQNNVCYTILKDYLKIFVTIALSLRDYIIYRRSLDIDALYSEIY